MIYFTLRNAIDFPTHQAQTPTKVYLFIMSEKAAVKSSCLPIIRRTDHHARTRSPQYLLLIIILAIITFYHTENPATTERITIFIQKTSTGAGILKTVLVIFCQQFRLTGCHLRMGIHKLYKRSKPMMTHLYIAIQKHIVVGLYLV